MPETILPQRMLERILPQRMLERILRQRMLETNLPQSMPETSGQIAPSGAKRPNSRSVFQAHE
jgi:hypothetical protein